MSAKNDFVFPFAGSFSFTDGENSFFEKDG